MNMPVTAMKHFCGSSKFFQEGVKASGNILTEVLLEKFPKIQGFAKNFQGDLRSTTSFDLLRYTTPVSQFFNSNFFQNSPSFPTNITKKSPIK